MNEWDEWIIWKNYMNEWDKEDEMNEIRCMNGIHWLVEQMIWMNERNALDEWMRLMN